MNKFWITFAAALFIGMTGCGWDEIDNNREGGNGGSNTPVKPGIDVQNPAEIPPNPGKGLVGSVCAVNQHCESGICDAASKKCVDNPNQNNKKPGKVKDGGQCSVNADCASRICVSGTCAIRGSDENIGNSGTGGENQIGGGSFIVNSRCKYNSDCESGLCMNGLCSNDCENVGCQESNYVCRHNKCIPTSTKGKECKDDNACALGSTCCNGFCHTGRCEPGIFCDRGNNASCLSGECREYRNSYICGCTDSAQCGNSQFCVIPDTHAYQDYFPTSYNICIERMMVNSPCYLDIECKSGACYENLCVNPLDLNQPCDSDGDCKTKTCDYTNNVSGKYCLNKYEIEHECRIDDNCASGKCLMKKCVVK